ncbi:MAG TPA: bifunctional transaldolase/phosoglucose isomerase [Brevefilum sp.]|nr:bifunctional transaldolase/phosoglucose isomerase [Brevefilum sp.]HOR18891.1 bifunctional transaldolase/phosoglucose isomerase [Brevefilum sp.]HPL70028.1 bifunctional transaldolase/phosoglucose isomerase [Brevefilum sp.]
MSKVIQLSLLGQSIWYDNLKRSLIKDGTIAGMIERREILGITSNPSIFEKAIISDTDYQADLQLMAWAGLNAEEIFYRLAIQDIQDAADLFKPYYEASNGADGFVSLEVNPKLADDTQGTIDEAMWLWQEVNRPNLMVKIPATRAGLPAITEVIAAGINVNVTLIFSRIRYREVMDAYLSGLEKRLQQGGDISQINSVASFFVSRFDSNADARLERIIQSGGKPAEQAAALKGKLAVDNTRLAYQDYLQFFDSPRFAALAKAGARKQRPLWASTSTKNPDYNDIMYVDELVAENSINTVPPETLLAYLEHGIPKLRIEEDLSRAESDFIQLAELGISIDEITQELEDDGVWKFAESFEGLLKVIESQRKAFVKGLGSVADRVSEKVKQLKQEDYIARLFRNDPTLWTMTSEGQITVQTRLGWRDLPGVSQALIPKLEEFSIDCLSAGFTRVLVIGMGGSSLAPEIMALILGGLSEGMDVKIIDSTLPEQIHEIEKWVDYSQTLFILASKSGTTNEPLALYGYFREKAERALGNTWAAHFIAITDPGSYLAELGEGLGFRAVFTADSNVGGRYSALTHFGLVPAALLGIDLHRFLSRAQTMAERCSPATPIALNPGALLGVILGVSAMQGQDKLTLLTDEAIAPIGAWLEQLIAESSGKEGRGIVPIVDEPQIDAIDYAKDRIFVYLRACGEQDDFVKALEDAGHVVVVMQWADLYDLAAHFYCWEFATAVVCSLMAVNAFDQPDVQDSKDRTKQKLAAVREKGVLEEPDPDWAREGVKIYGQPFVDLEACDSLQAVIESFAALAEPGDYIAINAFLPLNVHNHERLTALRARILAQTGCATILGFGPRFLHSTGQLHKGGPNTGVFLQITQDNAIDFEIPGESYSFGVLARAQALGDFEALLSGNRRAVRIHLPAGDPLTFV